MPHSTYMSDKIGSAAVSLPEEITAGDYESFDLVYTAGFFGIDDSGSIKIVQRFASDMAKPQFDDPSGANYVTVEPSNGAVLAYHFDVKNNIRPWGKTLYIKVVKGYLRQGDTITVRYGNRQDGSPGIRMQTFCEDTFELKVLVDAFATYDYVELPHSPTVKIVSGEPVRWVSVLPSLRTAGEKFRLCIKAEDKWGNPSDKAEDEIFLKSNLPVNNLPETVRFQSGNFAPVLENLSVDQPGDLYIEMRDKKGDLLCVSNPLRIEDAVKSNYFWADLHAQSEETIGTNSIEDYFSFGRDKAFLDAACHQGNDFQITKNFWRHLNEVTAKFNQQDRFVTFPGYEYSANTGLGGDHNILFLNEGEQIHRSSHALIYDLSDADTDRHTTAQLFDTLKGRDVFVFAHVGGRYADLNVAKASGIVPAIEIHSAWGTFEWLLHDALKLGMRVGVVANSDGHKGRPGASFPGASQFGSYGGLTCLKAQSLTRKDLFNALKRRSHYATTGTRILLDLAVEADGKTFAIGQEGHIHCESASLKVSALGTSGIERIDVFNGTELLHSCRAYDHSSQGNRIRIIWAGAEYRGRGRETTWDGKASLDGSSYKAVEGINFWNPEKPLRQISDTQLCWQSITTGGIAGFTAELQDSNTATLTIETPLVNEKIEIAKIGYDPIVFKAGGLDRQLSAYKLPKTPCKKIFEIEQELPLKASSDNPVHVRVVQEDGHMAWSSPVYLIRE